LRFFFFITFSIKPEPAIVSLIINFGLFFIVLITLIFFLKKKKLSWQDFGFTDIKFKWVFYSFLLIFLVISLGGGLSTLLSKSIGIEGGDLLSLKEIMSDKNWINILNFKIGIALLIPFAEEVLFRGFLFRYIRQEKSFLFSAVLSSLLFSLIHFNLTSLPFTLLLGLATAFTYEKGKSLYYPFFIHMGVNNLASTMFLLSLFS